MSLRRSLVIAVAVLALAPAAARAASQGYDVSVIGSQSLSWKVDGTSGDCEVRRGAGSGQATFRYSSKRSLAFANAYGRTFNFTFGSALHAKGRQEGTFSDTLATACPGFGPAPTATAATSACGPTDFWMSLVGEVHGAFLYVAASEAIERPSKPPRNDYALCPFANVTGGDIDNALAPTGPVTGGCDTPVSVPLWRQTRELATQGRGLAAFRFPVSKSGLLHPRSRTTTLARRIEKTCNLPVSYSGGVSATLTSQLTITLRRH